MSLSELATNSPDASLNALQTQWQAHWQPALRCWSAYVQLTAPIWCHTAEQEKQESLTGSFAMIRLLDHRIVISLRQIAQQHLEEFAVEILAHEIGHHVYCPADLTDNARAMARLRAGLPTKENLAPFVGNLYMDLLINDRLQRSANLSMAAVYQRLNIQSPDPLWTLYMRTYELLWQLDRGTLAHGKIDARLNADAQLCTRLIRSYAKDWLEGAGRFAALCLPYLLHDDAKDAQKIHQPWSDTKDAGKGGTPDGLTEIDPNEKEGAIHPSEDAALSGLADNNEETKTNDEPSATSEQQDGISKGSAGRKTLKQYRAPFEYKEIMKAAGCTIPEDLLIANYYRERALPHLIRFPQRPVPQATDPMPEGLESWDVGSPLADVDWIGTLLRSPTVIPGFTTVERIYGSSPGHTPETLPVDLYLGVDCSGSMGNPATQMSYPILAGAIMALSALRAGARVMVALSGEPGRTITTNGFIRDASLVLKTLTDYLGTGTTFGIHRLADTFAARRANERPVHILIITDNDIFPMLSQTNAARLGWDVARTAVQKARGGATYVLQLPAYLVRQTRAQAVINPGEARMKSDGWDIAHVDSMEEIMTFARRFSQLKYGQPAAPPRNKNGK